MVGGPEIGRFPITIVKRYRAELVRPWKAVAVPSRQVAWTGGNACQILIGLSKQDHDVAVFGKLNGHTMWQGEYVAAQKRFHVFPIQPDDQVFRIRVINSNRLYSHITTLWQQTLCGSRHRIIAGFQA
jgi:hypothetical protein